MTPTTEAMKVLITGSRSWDDYELIHDELKKLPANSTIVHGNCKGADIIAGEIAKEMGFIVREYPADWVKYGKAAGPIRNRHMATSEHLPESPIDLCLVFHDCIETSTGTKDMVSIIDRLRIPKRLLTRNNRHT